MQDKHYISLNVGGTNARVALVRVTKNKTPEIIKKVILKISPIYDQGISDLITIVNQLKAGNKIVGLAGGFPGIVDQENPKNNWMSNLPDWSQKDYATDLSKGTSLSVKVMNDTVAATLGETFYGQGKNKKSFTFIIWGTGFGGTHMKKVGSKTLMMNFEPGHHIVDWNGKECVCGQIGCAEKYIGGGPLFKSHPNLQKYDDSHELWNEVAEKASQTLINTLHFYPTETFVFSGGVILNRPSLLAKIQKHFENRQQTYAQPECIISTLGDDAGLLGATTVFELDIIIT